TRPTTRTTRSLCVRSSCCFAPCCASRTRHSGGATMSNTEFEWRGYRIIHTTDKKLIGETKDRFGFPVTQGWIVRDCFDDNPIPPPTQWFYTPYDAIAAVEIVEAMRENTTPWTSFNAAYYGSMHLRNHFW